MKKLQPFLLMTACSAVILAAAVLSCTDHQIDPPDTGCARVDGSPRYYLCEFQIVKAEFTRGYLGEVIATATPENRKITLPVSAAFVNIRPVSGYADVTYKVKLYIKRISSPSVSSSDQYVIPHVSAVVSDLDAAISANRFPPLFPPLSTLISIPVGQTFVMAKDASYRVKEDFGQPGGKAVYTNPSGVVAYLVYNMQAANTLAAAPHNYQNILDLAEGHLIVEPAFVE
ncbi:hypothetical protein [Dyadobacter sp. OTU695]|uniref:hypothetical protein n=1 Tax=Dyadobacter sp. OTU695 TaxID=3043860 RepID=UPI00313B0F57